MPQDSLKTEYPHALRLDLVEELHGHPVVDPYRWLEDASDERTEAWSCAQDNLYSSARASWPRLGSFRERLTALYAVGDVSAPVWRSGVYFAVRRDPGQDHGVLRVNENGAERVLVDPIAIDPAGTTTLDFWVPSPDGRRLAYGMSENGTEQSVIRVMDIADGQVIEDPIDRVRHSPISWLPDSDGFYYVRHLPEGTVPDDDSALYRRVYLHMIGANPDDDELIFGAGMERSTYFGVSVSEDGRWLCVSSMRGSDRSNDMWLSDRHSTDPAFTPIQQDIDAQAFLHVGRDGVGYILTNRDAPRWRLCAADPVELLGGSGYASWRTLIIEDPTAVLSDYALLDGEALPAPLMVTHRTRHALSEITVHDAATGVPIHDIALPGTGTADGITARRGGGHEVWISYTDFTTPGRILRYDATTGVVDLWEEPVGAIPTEVEVVTRHVTYPSKDGTEVRMFLVSGAGNEGPAPTIIYGYGGFDISVQPVYGPSILAWIEAGGVYAIANLRGGGEEGEQWHRSGMREAKQNVFDDLHAAADWLVAEGITTYAQLGIYGGSNGGLLVGAAVTQHPEKYAAVVCSAALLDMIRYEQFGLGSNWHGEFGSAAVAEEFEWLLGYSPYHHVTDGTAYPAIVFTVFDGDTRVDPMHGRKLCAAMQHATGGDQPILIRREKGVGHSSRAVSKMVDLAAERIAFFAAHLSG